jgi:hypothetical protein
MEKLKVGDVREDSNGNVAICTHADGKCLWSEMGLTPYEDDAQFEESTVDHVESSSAGWSVTGDHGWSIYVTDEQEKIAPAVGERMRLYGRGIGYPVRGIVIGGRTYRYETPEQHDASQQALHERMKTEREEADAKFKANAPNLPPLPGFAKVDESVWNDWVAKNDNPYGYACCQYAAQWANLMEAAMASGQSIADCAEKTSHEADTDGITGFMYGCAVIMLAKCWVHGEELRRWHNHETQIGDEGDKANESGGVLNPALLSIGAVS